MIKKMEWMPFMMLLLLLFYYIKNKSLKDMHYSDFTTVEQVLSMFHGWPLMAYCFNKIGIEQPDTFNALKQINSSQPTMKYYNLHKPFTKLNFKV